MHIHPVNLPPPARHVSEAAQSAKQSDATRKKLREAAGEFDLASAAAGAWMLPAWSGDQNQSGYGQAAGDSRQAAENESEAELAPVSPAGSVSFWA